MLHEPAACAGRGACRACLSTAATDPPAAEQETLEFSIWDASGPRGKSLKLGKAAAPVGVKSLEERAEHHLSMQVEVGGAQVSALPAWLALRGLRNTRCSRMARRVQWLQQLRLEPAVCTARDWLRDGLLTDVGAGAGVGGELHAAASVPYQGGRCAGGQLGTGRVHGRPEGAVPEHAAWRVGGRPSLGPPELGDRRGGLSGEGRLTRSALPLREVQPRTTQDTRSHRQLTHTSILVACAQGRPLPWSPSRSAPKTWLWSRWCGRAPRMRCCALCARS